MRLDEFDKQVTQADIDQLEIFADRLFAKVGIDVEFTRHFLDRVNDERNVRQITVSELTRLFKQEFKKWGKKIAQLGPDAEAVMKDLQTDINMPFALRWDSKNQELDLIAKTVMRKQNFRTPNQEFAVESVQFKKALMEGGSLPGVGAIHIDEIQPTLRKLEKELGVDLVNNALGSVGKREFSGDIDVALKIDAEDIPQFIEKLKASKNIHDMAKSSVIMTKVRIEDFDANKSDGRPRTGYVQLDFMPGDPDWLKTYYHSPREDESKYKGVYRNIMIAAIAANFDREDSPETIEDGRPIESKRYMWSPTDGLIRVSRTPVAKKSGGGYTKKNQNKRIAGPWKNGEEIAQQLKLDSASDLNSFETLLTAIKKNYGEQLQQRIIKDFIENNQIQDMGVPEELK